MPYSSRKTVTRLAHGGSNSIRTKFSVRSSSVDSSGLRRTIDSKSERIPEVSFSATEEPDSEQSDVILKNSDMRGVTASPLQQTLLTAQLFFRPDSLSRGELAKTLAFLLSSLTLHDFGVDATQSFLKLPFRSIGYLPILHQKDFHVGLFLLRKGSIISLHDHPEMVVFSKVLHGELKVRLFKWENEGGDIRNSSMARYFEDPMESSVKVPAWPLIQEQEKIATPETPPILIFNKVHCLTAESDVVLVDFLGPPYDAEEDRGCTYFREVASELGSDTSPTRLWVAKNPTSDYIETISHGNDGVDN